MTELFRNSLSYASSLEQLYEIKKKYVLPTLLTAGEQHYSSWSRKIVLVRGKMKKQIQIFQSRTL